MTDNCITINCLIAALDNLIIWPSTDYAKAVRFQIYANTTYLSHLPPLVQSWVFSTCKQFLLG